MARLQGSQSATLSKRDIPRYGSFQILFFTVIFLVLYELITITKGNTLYYLSAIHSTLTIIIKKGRFQSELRVDLSLLLSLYRRTHKFKPAKRF